MKLLKEIAKIKTNNLAKVASLNVISSAIKVITSFLSTKIMASIVGPSGIALIGQLSNFLSIAFAFSTAGINGGVVKYIAENKNSPRKLKYYISTSFWIIVVFSFTIGILTIIFNNYLSLQIFYNKEFGYIFILLGFTIILYSINILIVSILNGFKLFEKYTKINVASSIFVLFVTVALAYFWKLQGALIALTISQSIVVVITIYYVFRENWLKKSVLLPFFSKKVSFQFFRYSLMAMATALMVPTAQFFIRSYIIKEMSLNSAGIWEGMNKVSNMYLVVITTTLSIYFLPRFSEIKNNLELKTEIFKAYKFTVPALILMCTCIFFLKDFIIRIAFTRDFLPMKQLFLYQLLGDIAKMSSWILGTVMVSKAMYKEYIAMEIVSNVLLYLLSVYFMKIYGIEGAPMGYLISLILTVILMAIVFRKLLFAKVTS